MSIDHRTNTRSFRTLEFSFRQAKAAPVAEHAPSSDLLLTPIAFCAQLAKILQEMFAHLDNHATPSYELLLRLDAQMKSWIEHVPRWMKEGGPTAGMRTPRSLLSTQMGRVS